MGGRGGSSGMGAGKGNQPLQKGKAEKISTYYRRGALGGYYHDEALDAKFDKATGMLTFSSASDKEWRVVAKTNKTKHVDITVQNGAINGRPINVNLNSTAIQSISAAIASLFPLTTQKAPRTARARAFTSLLMIINSIGCGQI